MQGDPPEPQLASVAALHVLPWQQPPAQLVPLQVPPVQTPPTQFEPPAHGGVIPQRQTPVAEQLSAFEVLHPMQTAPPEPQAPTAGVMHIRLEQQPPGQVWALQAVETQLPVVHFSVALHALPAPQVHLPLAAEHPSARLGSQLTQAAPAVPQAEKTGAVHVAPAQQPLGQVVPVQAAVTHKRPRHCWPAPQAGPVPQVQVPAAEQVSAALVLQARHTAPGGAHLPSANPLHVEPWQQPVGQEAALHAQTPRVHWAPAAHAGPAPHEQLPPRHPSAVVGVVLQL